MRTLVIGDIHGGLKALIQLLERAKVTTDDHLIFLGDYVDGWSESAQTINFLIELIAKQHCIFIKGNHDVECENWLKTGKTTPNWLLHGGVNTMKSYENISAEIKQKHILLFNKMPLYHVSKHGNLFIHAGFTSMHGPEKEIHLSNFYWDRTLWEMALAMDNRMDQNSPYFPKRLALFNEIFIGHTPTIHFDSERPMKACNLWNLDTGAAFTGKLSCMDIHTKEIWQSDPVYNLYPNELGRNKKIIK